MYMFLVDYELKYHASHMSVSEILFFLFLYFVTNWLYVHHLSLCLSLFIEIRGF